MRILITGVGGFVANNVAEWLKDNSNHEITGIYRTHRNRKYKYDVIQCDLYGEADKIKGLQYDAIIHFASQLYGDSIKCFLDNTVQVTRNIIDIAQEKKIKKVIYISSISVCGETRGMINEASDRINLNDYELTKYIGERLLEDADIEEKVILRLPRMLGKEIDYNAPWLPKVSYNMLNNRDVIYYNPELEYNAVLHTDTLAEFILHILDDSIDNGVYMLGADEAMTIFEILNFIKTEVGSSSKLMEVKQNGANRCHSIDISKAKEKGFQAKTVRETLIQYLEDMRGESR